MSGTNFIWRKVYQCNYSNPQMCSCKQAELSVSIQNCHFQLSTD